MLIWVNFWLLLSISSSVSLKCKPGQYESYNNCISCPKGTYVGYYSDVTGSTKCRPCPKGHWCDDPAKTPVPCPKGTHQDKFGERYCSPCTPGYYSNREGSLNCTACPKGHFVIFLTQEKHQFHAQKEHIKPNLENCFARVALLDITLI